MLQNTYKKIQYRALFVGLFILVAIVWWTVLLHRMNKELYDLKKEQVTLTLSDQASITKEIEKFDALEKRKSRMILAEGLTILIGILIGVWFINRSYSKMIQGEILKTNFALAISHELKSPLTAISLSFDMLRRKLLGDDSAEMVINTGKKETSRLTRLINDILLGQSLETGYQAHLEKTDIRETTNEIVQSILFQYPESSIEIHITLDKKIIIDKKAYHHSVLNLVENAVKYSGKGAVVDIHIKLINQTLQCQIKDNGPGIPENHRSLIFNKFYRVGDESTRKTKGTGLGLYIVERLMKFNKGKVSYEPNNPNGSIFKLQIPVQI